MTLEALQEFFSKYEDEEFLKFVRIREPRSKRADLHAFMLLDELCPGTSDMVADAHHDEIFLEPSPDKLADVVTEDQLLELIRCGVRYDSEYDTLAMFV